MKVLVDTHIFLWAITGDLRLSRKHRALWLAGGNELSLSFVSIWEILIKAGLGKLPLPTPHTAYILAQMEKNRLSLQGVRASHFAELESLPPIHRDPFDRMLVAQALAEGIPIATVDPIFRRYGVKTL